VNAAAYVVVVVGGVALELLASNTTKVLASDHRVVAVVLVAVIAASFHGLVLGRWQWRILATPDPRPAAPPVGDRHPRPGALRVVARDRTRGLSTPWRSAVTPSPRSRTASYRRSSSDP
jgi:hypothetical protein